MCLNLQNKTRTHVAKLNCMTIPEPKMIYSRLLQIFLKQDLPPKNAMDVLEGLLLNQECSKGGMM
jgi:Cdc6-like AAA superfamily ATPase